MGVGISKVANLLKSLDSEIGDPESSSGPGSEDKIGIPFIMTQSLCRTESREIFFSTFYSLLSTFL